MTPTYDTRCPKCGASLSAVALDPLTAPWLCSGCARGYWTSELTTSARALFRPQHHDFGFTSESLAIQAQVAIEIEQALGRGTSLRDDQLHTVDVHILQGVKGTGSFADQVVSALKERSGV